MDEEKTKLESELESVLSERREVRQGVTTILSLMLGEKETEDFAETLAENSITEPT
jgi:hypothetical protein